MPSQSLRSVVALGFATALVIACGAPPPRPLPCMSDAECRADRICHRGQCRFLEEARAEVARETAGSDTRADAAVTATAVDAATPVAGLHDLPTFMGSPQRTGRTNRRGPVTAPREVWAFATNARIFGSPIVHDGSVFVGSLDGSLIRLNAAGTLVWRQAIGDRVYGTPSVDARGTIYIGSANRAMVALGTDGAPRYRRDVGGEVHSSPLVTGDGHVYVAADGIYSFDADGNVAWHHVTASNVRSTPAWHPRRLIIFGSAEGKLVALNERGDVAWERDLEAPIDGGPAVGDDGTIVVGTDGGHLVALSADGNVRWRFRTGGDVRATPAIAADGTIIVGSYDRNVYAIAADGSERWRVATSGRVRASARIDADGRIYVGSQDDFLYAIAPTGAILWRVNVGQDVDSTCAIGDDGTLYVGADDGSLHAYR